MIRVSDKAENMYSYFDSVFIFFFLILGTFIVFAVECLVVFMSARTFSRDACLPIIIAC